MNALVNLEGQRFGRLTVLSRDKSKLRVHWLCLCDCGATKSISGNAIRRGSTVSCGCRMREIGGHNKAHGMRFTKEYEAWKHMKARCSKTYDISYKNYGAIGITVCDEWKSSFDLFFKHIGPCPSERHSIDRIDVSKGYFPGNVKWSTATEQQRNKRNTRWVEYMGEKKSLAEWCESLGMKYRLVEQRLRVGWPVQKAFTQPAKATQ